MQCDIAGYLQQNHVDSWPLKHMRCARRIKLLTELPPMRSCARKPTRGGMLPPRLPREMNRPQDFENDNQIPVGVSDQGKPEAVACSRPPKIGPKWVVKKKGSKKSRLAAAQKGFRRKTPFWLLKLTFDAPQKTKRKAERPKIGGWQHGTSSTGFHWSDT